RSNLKWINELTHGLLTEEMLQCGMKRFTADQVFPWIYDKNIRDIDAWFNISKPNRKILSQKYNTALNGVVRETGDQEGTKKILFQLTDKHRVESVLIKEKEHYTFCISTQVGCALGCKFCATGGMGFKRNLTPGEILSQVLSLRNELHPYTGKLNLVFMGMGEPLLNYENLKQALEIITAEKCISISPRNITVSTVGITEPLRRLETDFPRVKISFSLNAPGPALRETLMPISKKEKLTGLLNYFRETAAARKHRITFEYVLLKGVNDSLEDAGKIARLLRGIPCKVNVIPYNHIEGMDFKTPEPKAVEAFSDYLHSKGYTVMVRWSKGRDIKSACGQLAADEPAIDHDRN
ncbi:MAG: 23S rRNA (adenine(2503)-C(2))-methyltransferase RlmN, partial [bacterium]|nr:23S rRNA (adenine(2503)-C(2))-methyltransferase RlmN [bacterium]